MGWYLRVVGDASNARYETLSDSSQSGDKSEPELPDSVPFSARDGFQRAISYNYISGTLRKVQDDITHLWLDVISRRKIPARQVWRFCRVGYVKVT